MSKRPLAINSDKYKDGYDDIFNRCEGHPKYKGKRKPKSNCIKCLSIWRNAQQ